MKPVGYWIAAALLTVAASPAIAADWWMIPGQAGDRTAMFADQETLVRSGDGVGISVLRIDRVGRSFERFENVECGARAGSRADEALRRFACASEQDRDQFGLILASMTPADAARMVFGETALDPEQF